jgi:hypothetical protein
MDITSFLRQEVPKEIQAVFDRGGVNDRDWAWVMQEENDDIKDLRPLNILMRADEYLLYGSPDKMFQGWQIFCKAITILSFISGGVRIFDLHFSATIEGFVEEDFDYGGSKA